MPKEFPQFLSKEDAESIDNAARATVAGTEAGWIKEGNTLGLSRAEFEAQYGSSQMSSVPPVEKS